MKISVRTKKIIRLALAEDLQRGDKTARLLVPRAVRASAVVVAKESGILCGQRVCRELAVAVDRGLKMKWKVKEGAKVRRHQTLLHIQGRLASLLALERTLLNFLAHLSGVATNTHQMVKKVRPYDVRILDTRKTTPLLRELEKAAVRAGGGFNHRFGLYDEVFVKENHRRKGNLNALKKIPRKFVIEVRNKKELEEALSFRPRVILFDNFKPSRLRKMVKIARSKDAKVLLEASGGIHLKNVSSYARTGIDQISVGSLTHSVKSLDLSMVISSQD